MANDATNPPLIVESPRLKMTLTLNAFKQSVPNKLFNASHSTTSFKAKLISIKIDTNKFSHFPVDHVMTGRGYCCFVLIPFKVTVDQTHISWPWDLMKKQ